MSDADPGPPLWMEPNSPWWAKMRRASKLIAELKDEYRALNSPGAGWRVDREPADARTWLYRFRVLRPVPSDLAALVGDVIHNLRSSLDQIAYHLAVSQLGVLTNDQEKVTEFPIKVNSEAFETWLSVKSHGLRRSEIYGDQQIRALRCVQPFAFAEEAATITGQPISWLLAEDEQREDPAFLLNTLWNVDKHRRLPSLSWVVPTMGWPQRSKCEVVDGVRLYEPLSDGAVLLLDRGRHARPDREPMLDFDLILDDSPSWGDRTLLPTLDAFHRSLSGWIIPRMLHVADGHPPPAMIPSFSVPPQV